jgi:hypothetical protein
MSRFVRNHGVRSTKEPVPEAECDLCNGQLHGVSLQDVPEEKGKPAPVCSVEVHFHTAKNWGGRHENEDRWTMLHDSHKSVDFYQVGVMDGHDSDLASDMVSRLLPTVVSKHLKEGKPIVEAYAGAMEEIEDALKKRVSTAGTCVCSCLIAGRYVWCSNLGDCRAALVQLQVPEDGKPQAAPKVSGLFWLSRDHKASAPEEMKRIADAGGKVVDGRVDPAVFFKVPISSGAFHLVGITHRLVQFSSLKSSLKITVPVTNDTRKKKQQQIVVRAAFIVRRRRRKNLIREDLLYGMEE